MPRPEPTAEMLRSNGAHSAPTAWRDAERRLVDGEEYWLTTLGADGRPHVVPLLGLWVDGALLFVANASTRKARNLADDPRCVVAVAAEDAHLVVEGVAAKVREESILTRAATLYAEKYGWPVEVRRGQLWGDGAPTSGGPPYDVYAVVPQTVFAFGKDESFSPTRWRFSGNRA